MSMKNFSILEAVEVSLTMEEEGIRFYDLAERRAGDPELKRLFGQLREKEHAHVDTFRRLYSEIAAREGDADAQLWLLAPEVSAHFRAYVEASVFPAKGAAEQVIDGLHGAAEILRCALRLEKDSILFYHELLAHAPWPLARELLERVIDEERRHVVALHEKLAGLGG